MAEPTVPVPVSLIERMRFAYSNHRENERPDFVREMLALLSQPTPTAEPCERCGGTGYQGDGPDTLGVPCLECSVTPPSIADLAPGTTFTWDGHRLMRMSATAQYAAVDDGGFLFALRDIDPSTIREVTPPKET